MWIKAQIVGSSNRERETQKGLQYITELFMVDADYKQNLYIGQIWGEKVYSYEENEVVTFQVTGMFGTGKKIYLTLKPEEIPF